MNMLPVCSLSQTDISAALVASSLHPARYCPPFALSGVHVAPARACRSRRLASTRTPLPSARPTRRARRPAARVPLAPPSPAPPRLCPHFALRGMRTASTRASRQRRLASPPRAFATRYAARPRCVSHTLPQESRLRDH